MSLVKLNLFILSILIIVPRLTIAQQIDHLIITELAIKGPGGAYDEFVEIYNPTPNSIDISGWRLQSKPVTGDTWINRTGENGLPANSMIPSKGYFLIAAENYSLSISPDYRHSARWGLSDKGGHIRIIRIIDKNSTEIDEIDKVGYGVQAIDAEGGQSALVPQSSGQSLGRKNINGEFQDTNNNYNDFIIQELANPQNSKSSSLSSENKQGSSTPSNNSNSVNNPDSNIPDNSNIPTPPNSTQYSNQVIISEFLPNPKGDDNEGEWIEIYNFGKTTVNLKDWQIDDKVNIGSNPFIFSEDFFLNPGEFRALFWRQTKIIINNTDEELNLLSPDSKIVYKVSFKGEAPESASFAWDGNTWQWTTTLTPGTQNIISPLVKNKEQNKAQESKESKPISQNDSSQDQKADLLKIAGESKNFPLSGAISEIKKAPAGTWVKFKGWVVVEDRVFGEKIIYVNDQDGGIKVNLANDNFSLPIKRGDEIEFLGYVNNSNSQKQINLTNLVESVKPIGHKKLTQELISTGQINKLLESQLVNAEGEVLAKDVFYFWLDDGSGKIKIYLGNSLKSALEKFEVGSTVNVSGVIEVDKENFYLKPRDENDLVITKLAGVITRGSAEKDQVQNILNGDKNVEKINDDRMAGGSALEGEITNKKTSNEITKTENEDRSLNIDENNPLFNIWFYFICGLILSGGILIWKYFPPKK